MHSNKVILKSIKEVHRRTIKHNKIELLASTFSSQHINISVSLTVAMTKLNSLDLGSQLLAITQDRGDYMVYIIWIFKDIHNHFCIYLNNKERYIHITAKHKPIPKSP